MSKKNSLNGRKESFIKTSSFNMDESKLYIVLTIVMFHILPLFLKLMGENGNVMLAFMYPTTNPIFIGIVGLIYGMKESFNFKFPGIVTVLSFLSVVMYGSFEAEMSVITPVVLGIVYCVFAYLSTTFGALLSKLFKL